jgi:2-amino-4-hydroxy-6-hydroxymethyldihydropteridine diphosphokinase
VWALLYKGLLMAKIHINIGSNQNRKKNICGALAELELIFSNLQLSSLYESPSEGFNSDYFYNIGVNAITTMSVIDSIKAFKSIEDKYARDRSKLKFSSRTIDLDLLLYESVVDENRNLPSKDILKYAFCLAPLAELSPDLTHPIKGESYQALWQVFKLNKKYKLTQYSLDKLFKLK